MRQLQYTVDRNQVHQHARHVLQSHLKLKDFSAQCPAGLLLTILVAAAARLSSLSDACGRLLHAPSDETARKALLATLPEDAVLQRQLNRALAADVPKALRRHRPRLAVDLVLIPDHGQHQHDPAEVYRSHAKKGTSHFHAYATADVIHQGRRSTVALTPVSKGEALEVVLRRLLQQASRAGIRPRLLLLDRGFSSVGVIRSRQAARTPFLMPVIGRGRKASDPRGPSGTNVFRYGKHSGWGSSTLSDSPKRRATVSIGVKCRNDRGQWPRHGRQRLVYASWGMQPGSSNWVAETYRQRLGIETSYRQLHQARIKTTSRSPLVRLLSVGVALILRNVWVWLHDQVLATWRRGGRPINPGRLRFPTLLLWLLHVAEETLGTRDVISAERPL